MEWIETFEAILRAMLAQAEAERQKIDLAYRHQGLGTALVAHIESLPEYSGLRGILLTRDAHELCRKFGYGVVNGRAMVKALNC